MKKKLLTYLLCTVLLVTGLCGCQSGQNVSNQGQESTEAVSQESSTDAEEAQSAETESTEVSEAQESVQAEVTAEPVELTIADISSMDLVADMKIGWNLGNTLDATGGIALDSERSWGNPTTTEEMIDAVLDAGFNVIRIPVTWYNHCGDGPDYQIHEIWLNRVQEVVDYAYDKGAYVIINMHHEDWHFPSEDNKEAAAEKLEAIWTQIATRFRDYDEHLIFEGLNEPRKIGTNVEWNGGDMEGREVVNYLEQVFVDAVRATGGNNTLRHLMITGYAASSDKGALESIQLPDDDKLIISVHAYTPYNFALNANGTSVWDEEKDAGDIDYLMNNLNELFISKGIPVIIGEFGAVNKDNEEERIEWVSYYLTKAGEIGVPCIWWDNNAFDGSGENFGLFNRRELTFPYPNLLDAMMTAVE